MAGYTAKTQAALTSWWITGTSTDGNNRLSDLIADQADGPYYDVADSWTSSAGDAAEYYHAPSNQPDEVYVSGVKLTEKADDTCADGGGGGLSDGEWCWETGNSRVYVQVAAGDPGATADFYYNWSGGYAGVDFLVEDNADFSYTLKTQMEVGDGTTFTALNIDRTSIYIDDISSVVNYDVFTIKANASFSGDGFYIYWYSTSGNWANLFDNEGTLTLENFVMQTNDESRIRLGSDIGGNCSLKHGTLINLPMGVTSTSGTKVFERLTVDSPNYIMIVCGGDIDDIEATRIGDYGFYISANYMQRASNVRCSQSAAVAMLRIHTNLANDVDLVDFTLSDWSYAFISTASMSYKVNRVHTVNISVAKPDGTLFDDEVTVTCKDKNDAQVFSVTTSSGAIAEQEVTVHEYYYNGGDQSGTLGPFTFTLSATGYETLVLDGVTIDSAIDWHLELQDEVVYPAAADVESGVQYGDGGDEFTGTFVVPAEEDVENGVGYGAGGTEFTGTFGFNWTNAIIRGVDYKTGRYVYIIGQYKEI